MKPAKVLLASLLLLPIFSRWSSAGGLVPNGFAFSAISNKFIAPNGLNRTVVFTFQNPSADQVSGRIFDLHGALVAELGAVTGTTLSWDAKANGHIVAGGVYIYMLESMTGRYSGTLVVIR